MNLSESQIREDIFLSARRIVSGLEVAKREQQNLARHIKALSEHGEHGAMSRLARDAGVSKQLFSEVLSGRKKVGAVVARRMAKVRI
jgi:hypothetical protein